MNRARERPRAGSREPMSVERPALTLDELRALVREAVRTELREALGPSSVADVRPDAKATGGMMTITARWEVPRAEVEAWLAGAPGR